MSWRTTRLPMDDIVGLNKAVYCSKTCCRAGDCEAFLGELSAVFAVFPWAVEVDSELWPSRAGRCCWLSSVEFAKTKSYEQIDTFLR